MGTTEMVPHMCTADYTHMDCSRAAYTRKCCRYKFSMHGLSPESHMTPVAMDTTDVRLTPVAMDTTDVRLTPVAMDTTDVRLTPVAMDTTDVREL